jgi:hexosaminidase
MIHSSLLLTFLCAPLGQTTELAIIPQPVRLAAADGSFFLTTETMIVAEAACAGQAEMLRAYLKPATGLPLRDGQDAALNAIILRVDSHLAGRMALPPAVKSATPSRTDADAATSQPASTTKPNSADEAASVEAYRLVVSSQRIEITGATPVGVFYGIQTLRQLLPPEVFRRTRMEAVRWQVPCVTIEDAPRFAWRGAHMDVSRHFMPREFVLKFLDLMALHKLNVFHWHLVDGPGWRIEIRKYPQLTRDGSRSDWSSMQPADATRSVNQSPGGFYTQEDIREVVAYAKERFITVVPEIEMPGHSYAAIKALPQFGNIEQIRAAGGDPTSLDGWGADVYNVDDETISFLKDILGEVLELFPSRFIHIGGDEVSKEPWKRNPRAQARMKALGLKNEEELQSWFIRQFDDFLTARGRRLIGWDEILEGGLASNATVMSWRGMAGGVAAAKSGHDVVMSPTSHTYFDYCQARPRQYEPRAIGGYLPLKVVYTFEPVPPELSESEARHVLGAQFQLWSEFIPHPKHVEYMAFPRGCALSEVVWSPQGQRNFDSFMRRLRTHLKRLDVLDVNYRSLAQADYEPVAQWKAGELKEVLTIKEWDITSAMACPGDYNVLFSKIGGANRLVIEWIEVLADDAVAARLDRLGYAGNKDENNEYRVTVRPIKPPDRYLLRASVRGDGGTDSDGEIYVTPASAK